MAGWSGSPPSSATWSSSWGRWSPGAEGLALTEHSRVETAAHLVAQVAEPVARLITEEGPSLVKRCTGVECTPWFLDRTKAHRRAYCSAAGCGNRAKVAAFRERQREG